MRISDWSSDVCSSDLQQSTVFDDIGGQFRPLTQSTVRKGLFLGKKVNGVYDWNTHTAQWQGSIKEARSQPIALHHGDMSGLLINLEVIRDARPGARLQYRFVAGAPVRRSEERRVGTVGVSTCRARWATCL